MFLTKPEYPVCIKYEFKILYALAIIFVVMGHCRGGGFSVFNEFLPFYSYHLALFIFSSGYFYKQGIEADAQKFIIDKAKKLIIPLYLWNIFYAVLIHILKKNNFFPNTHVTLHSLLVEPITNGHQFLLNLGGWFVIPLFMVHVFNIMVRRLFYVLKIKINEFVYFVCFLLLGFLGVYLSSHGFNNDWFLVLNRMLYFMPFYSLGILYKKYEKYDIINNLFYFGFLIFVSLVIIYKYGYMPSVLPSWANFYTSNVIKPFYVGIIGIAFWLRISKILSPAIGHSKCINIVADNTYSIMINHVLGFMILNTIFAFLHLKTNLCCGFDMYAYKTVWNYCYVPHNLNQFLILYSIFGILFSILFQKLITTIIKIGKSKIVNYIRIFVKCG